MNEAAEVYLWGRRIGVVSRTEGSSCASFAYDREFMDAGIEPSPLMMPVGAGTYSFAALPQVSFHGLPGMLSDSLPDKFGSAVLDAWLLSQGRTIGDLSAIDRLCYQGSRGMGALEYKPVKGNADDSCERIRVDALAALAADILKFRESGRAALLPGMKEYGSILKVGASAGGARAKAVIGWNESTGEVRSGQVALPVGFGYWIMKFDGLAGNGDKDVSDSKGYGRIEYAYSLMAKAAGIEMSECRLWEGTHFMTRRFDRTSGGDKIHMQTLGGLAHLDFNLPREYSYEQAFRVTREVVGDVRAEKELFRRMVFNVLAWNCDDHVKNISYLMDSAGEWRLSPAYDLTYSYNPKSRWVSGHQMSVSGKFTDISRDDMIASSRVAGIAVAEANEIIDEVHEAVARWREFADAAKVDEMQADAIARQLG